MTDSITPKDFLKTVFGGDLNNLPGEIIYTALKPDGRWQNRYAFRGRRGIPIGTAATYYCVSTVNYNPDYPRRSYKDVCEAWVVVCDDIGTKAEVPPLAPSYTIETSAGNFQYGYLIHPWDVTTEEWRREYDAVLYSLVLAGYNDPGCRNASRVVRLPGSLHKTGFIAQLKVWQPERVWDLEDLLPAFGAEKVYPSGGSGGEIIPGKYTRLEDVHDPVYHWLVNEGLVHGHSSEWVHITCPWHTEHTDGLQGAGSTSYSPEDYGTMAPAFKCLHGHCAARGRADFRAWLEAKGCPVTWGETDTLTLQGRMALASLTLPEYSA